MRRTSLFGDECLESKIYKYPIKDIYENNDIQTNLKENELKFYFVLDRYVYENINTETNESQIIFDSGFYLKKYDLQFSGDKEQYIRELALRTFSFHTLILGELLPFITIGITHKFKIHFPHLEFTSNYKDEFQLLRLKEKWKILENDLKILELNIKPNSSFQKALIWFTLAKLSNTNIETFMNLYKCLEEFTREFHQNIEKKFENFVKIEIPRFDSKIIKKFTKFQRPDANSLEAFLMLNNIDNGIISKVQNFRNKQIAHGNDYSLEFNDNFMQTIDEMEIFTKKIINHEIKKMKLEGLKNPDFLYDYYITISPSKRKIVLSDEYDLDYLRKQLMINNDGLIASYGLGQIADKDITSSIMLSNSKNAHITFCQDKDDITSSEMLTNLEHITIEEDMSKKLIENFGKIIDF